MQIAKRVILIGTLALPLCGFGFDIQNTASSTSQNQNDQMTPGQVTAAATTWGVTTNDYMTYQNYMQSTQAGLWYKDLDPAEVLGLMSNTANDRMKYARIEAQIQFKRVENEVAFANAFTLAINQAYPHLKPFDPAYAHSIQGDYGNSTSSEGNAPPPVVQNIPAQSGDYFSLFTTINSVQGDVLLGQIEQFQHTIPNITILIYIIGTTDQASIENWATQNKIPVDAVNSHQINISLDQGELAKVMGGYSGSYQPPILVRQRGGQQTVMSSSFSLDRGAQ